MKFVHAERLDRLLKTLTDEEIKHLHDYKAWGFQNSKRRLKRLLYGNLYLRLCETIKQLSGKNIYKESDFLDSLPEKHLKIYTKFLSVQAELLLIFSATKERGIPLPS